MSLSIRNNTGETIWVAIIHENDFCPGLKWWKEGWWEVGPGSNRIVYTGRTNNRRFYYFANSKTKTWPNFITLYAYVSMHKFGQCLDEPGEVSLGFGDVIAHADVFDNYTIDIY